MSTVNGKNVDKRKSMKSMKKDVDERCVEYDMNNFNLIWWLILIAITLTAFGTRLHKITEPDHVCWDETHFGKMASWYINGSFFFDVHPPLGKMLIGLAGYLTGYDGTFAFNKPGDKYGEQKYVGMRVFCASLGALIVPFVFIIVWDLVESLLPSILAAALINFDIGILTLSQYILLDPLLLFFVIGSFMCSIKFLKSKTSFTIKWWFWLCSVGVFIAGAVSVKFVGLFTVTLIGLQTIKQLWDLFGDCNLSLNLILKHFLARVIGLIILPLALYLLFFFIHLKVLNKSGTGDGFFSSSFQSQLQGNSLFNASMPRLLAYGAIVTIKNHRTGGGYLHSHWHLYPEGVGARQQQVTTYSHKDDNNRWVLKKYNDDDDEKKSKQIEFIHDGDLIRLEHLVTARNLHSHREIAPVSKKHYQVTCYGENGTGDANDIWRVEIVSDGVSPDEIKHFDIEHYNNEKNDRNIIQTVRTKFRLIHYFVGCALQSHSKQLPKWGFEQMEVSCNPNLLDKHNIWNIEDNHFERLPNISISVYAPSFIERFLESHAVMFQGNAGLKPKEGEVTSRPWQWPINYRGQFFSGNQYKIYLLGNPIIWWSNLFFLALYLIIDIIILIRQQRGCDERATIKKRNENFHNATSWLFIAWLVHYIPFYSMGRVLYFHHYFPALIFNSMLSAIVIDYLIIIIPQLILSRKVNSLIHFIYGVVFSIIVYSFYLFSPLSYGIISNLSKGNSSSIFSSPLSSQTQSITDDLQISSIKSLKWLQSWEF